MSNLSVLPVVLAVGCCIIIVQAAPGKPQQGTSTIQTPFGPKQAPPSQQPPPPAAAPVLQNVIPAAGLNTGNAAVQPEPQAGANTAQGDASPIGLHLDNQSVDQVIRIIGDALGMNYIVDPAVKGFVNINTSDTLRRSDLLPILETILKINNATMIKTGNFYQIVPANTAARQPIEVIDGRAPAPADDQVVLQVIRMRFVAAAEISRLLTPYLSEAGTIVVHETGNIVLLSDRRSNVRKLLEIVDIFDTAAFQGERVRLLPVKNNHARDVVDDLKTIFTGYGLSERQSAIRFIVIDRLNSVLVVTPNAEVFPEIERWLATLDQPVLTAGIRNFVYKAKNAKAGDLQRVLADLYNQPLPAASAAAGPPGALPLQNQEALQLPGAGQSTAAAIGQQITAPAAARSGTSARPASIRIIADEVNNALVIQATLQEYAEIQRTLEELDVLRRQVLIDAQVFEVVLDNSLSFGVSAQLQNREPLVNRQTVGSFASPAGIAANTFAFVGRTRELLLFLNASENRSRVRTLSAPSVLVTDNGTAQFQVGTEVPIPTSSSVTAVQSGGTNLFAQTIIFRNTGVILQVKPQINESGNVTLDIFQEISSAGANTVSAIVAPVIGKSSVTSQIVVEDGQTIAIGGFIRENSELARNRVPLLGRVPGVGVLFGNTRQANNRTELIVLLTPHVLQTHQDADVATDELKAKLKQIKGLLK